MLLCRGRLIQKNAVKPRAIDHTDVADFDRDQKATMINQSAGHDRLYIYLWPRQSDNASAAQEITIFCGPQKFITLFTRNYSKPVESILGPETPGL